MERSRVKEAPVPASSDKLGEGEDQQAKNEGENAEK